MSRSIPWDDLPIIYRKHVPQKTAIQEEVLMKPPEEKDVVKDFERVLKRSTFGLVCGSITGACFGFVDVVKDPKAMKAKAVVVTQRIFRQTYLFGGFFAFYQGTREACKRFIQYSDTPQTPQQLQQALEVNIVSSTVVCITPLIFVGSLRPMIPYGLLLIALDTINEFKDGM